MENYTNRWVSLFPTILVSVVVWIWTDDYGLGNIVSGLVTLFTAMVSTAIFTRLAKVLGIGDIFRKDKY